LDSLTLLIDKLEKSKDDSETLKIIQDTIKVCEEFNADLCPHLKDEEDIGIPLLH
jgi:iron-sulfur cluster repair protein YtfE (RIC family)